MKSLRSLPIALSPFHPSATLLGTHLSLQCGWAPPRLCGLFRAGSSLPILHILVPRPRLSPRQPRGVCREKPYSTGEANPSLQGEQHRPGGSLREQEAHVPGDNVPRAAVARWPIFTRSWGSGLLREIHQVLKVGSNVYTTQAKKTHWRMAPGQGPRWRALLRTCS